MITATFPLPLTSRAASVLTLCSLIAAPFWAQEEGEELSDVKTTLVPVGEEVTGQTAALVQPPDGRWLVDEEGREYYIDKYPKIEGGYRWIDEEKGIVRLRHLMPLEIFAHDDEFFYFKFLRPQEVDSAPAEAAQQFDLSLELAEADTLRLTRSDEGLPQEGQWRNGFVLADMNEDGHLDIVHAPARKSFREPRIFLGDGSGSKWTSWDEARYPQAPFDYGDVAVADFNGDGHQDMALAIHLTGFVVLVGDGKGTFAPWGDGLPLLELVDRGPEKTALRRPPGFSSRALVATDWNGDGRVDLLALAEGPGSPEHIAEGKLSDSGRALFVNQGDGTWKQQDDSQSFMGDHLILADLDADGRLDFVTDSMTVGDPNLLNFGTEGDELWRTESLPVERRRHVVRGLAVDDFDGDGARDIALSYRATQNGQMYQGIDLYLARDGEAGWEHVPVTTTTEELLNFRAMASGDLDQDGDADLVVTTSEGDGWILLNDGKAKFVRETAPEMTARGRHKFCSGYRVRIEDLDGNGTPEIVANFAGEPGSEQLFPAIAETRCRAFGALRVWSVESATAE